ncbi:MAG: UDP-3-O-acyl-N-acetylglucosamine deacetylase, partial [Nitrospinota bacterium]|nr:UDP-3-O-acyl-N-acetylglucosamine deacetylase [Nitrospinota bacterium]
MLGNGSVLIIDDETAITSSLEAILTDEGYKVYKANSGEKGIELALSESPDVILADVWMPGIDGIQTLQVLKESELHSEVILMSGHANIETAVKATKIGAFDFIEKPLSMETVIKVIAEAIESKEYKWSEKEGSSKGKNTSLKIPKLSNKKKQQKNKTTQKTISRSVVLYGRGLHSGLKTGLILEPLPPDSGIHFGSLTNPETIPADVLFVDNTNHSTNLKHGSVIARTIEHLMSALYAYGITNLLIKIGAEVPIMDGSSIVFCQEIEKALIIEQNKSINHIVIDKT